MSLSVASPSHRHRRNGLAMLAAAVALTGAGCAAQDPPSEAARPTDRVVEAHGGEAHGVNTASGEVAGSVPGVADAALAFWRPAELTIAEEVEPAGSLVDLAERSTLVVRGHVAAVRERASAFEGATTVMVDVDQVLKGSADAQVRVDVHVRVGRTEAGDAVAAPPEDYLWFLTPGDDEGVWYASSVTGVLGPGRDGAVTAVLQPQDTRRVVPADVATLDAAAARAGLAAD